MGAAQLIYLSLVMLELGLEIAKHGEPKTGRHNAGSTIVATILILALLWWGGFFG
ncbi:MULTISPECIES: hypothetical protein [Xanthomonas]|uniref:hypothetical protein n=1 Tax=Xanthomonas TaxID=338 RepID=UPI001C2C788F|nr:MULTISPECIES: hypothetical protein [Xanthomonas]QXF03598.1 hypothetical protein KJA71_09145 [Xanthomonas citri pv. citri]QXO96854.1 hypothetical protein IG630_24195 [Xanthomonas sp. WG16]